MLFPKIKNNTRMSVLATYTQHWAISAGEMRQEKRKGIRIGKGQGKTVLICRQHKHNPVYKKF